MSTFFIAAAVTGISLLWRNFRYDQENPANRVIDRFPYLIRKPITCGLCFTFWTALIATIFFVPFPDLLATLPYRFPMPEGIRAVMGFFAGWFVLGTVAAVFVYVIDTFFQVSHYFKHRTDAIHED